MYLYFIYCFLFMHFFNWYCIVLQNFGHVAWYSVLLFSENTEENNDSPNNWNWRSPSFTDVSIWTVSLWEPGVTLALMLNCPMWGLNSSIPVRPISVFDLFLVVLTLVLCKVVVLYSFVVIRHGIHILQTTDEFSITSYFLSGTFSLL